MPHALPCAACVRSRALRSCALPLRLQVACATRHAAALIWGKWANGAALAGISHHDHAGGNSRFGYMLHAESRTMVSGAFTSPYGIIYFYRN
jgi:hypothetical protein